MRLNPGQGYASLIRAYGSANSGGQFNVEMEASACSGLISAGWFGVSKYGEWQRRNGGLFRPVCGYEWPWGASVSVYVRPGDEGLARWDCTNSFSGGTQTDMTALC